eukprot:scaffold293429_cov27-Tisochrysis_lutea.AAC.2
MALLAFSVANPSNLLIKPKKFKARAMLSVAYWCEAALLLSHIGRRDRLARRSRPSPQGWRVPGQCSFPWVLVFRVLRRSTRPLCC